MIEFLLYAAVGAGLATAVVTIAVAIRDWRSQGKPAYTDPPPRRRTTFRLGSPHQTDCLIGIAFGDIRQITDISIWVNAENTDMEMARPSERSLSATIRYLGADRDKGGHVRRDLIADSLDEAVGDSRPVAPASVFVTDSGNLRNTHNVRYVIHVAAVQGEPGAGYRQVQNITQCVANVLTQAEQLAEGTEASSILVPLLGAGVGRADPVATARDVVAATIAHLDGSPVTSLSAVFFLAYTETEFRILTTELESIPGARMVGE